MKCIVSDFDGTLFDEKFNDNVLAIKEFVKNKNIFVLATGRTFKSIKGAIKDYNIPYMYLICSDGACIYDNNDNLIYDKVMNHDLLFQILSKIFEIDDTVQIKYDNNFDICDSDEKVGRILVNADIATKEKLREALNKLDNVYAYLSTNWLNISNINSDKTLAIKYLENTLGIDKDSIFVIGNDVNDYAMIEYYNGYLINRDVKDFMEFIKRIND